MSNPTTGWFIGGAASGTAYSPLTVSNSQASLTADYLPFYSAALQGTYAINLANLLGVGSQVVSINDPQTLTQKTLNNTNTYTAKDTSFTLQNAAVTTKQAQFLLSSITTGQKRIFTLPDYNATLATLDGTETLTSKSLTTPVTTALANTGGLSTDTLSVSGTATLGNVSISGNNGITANNLATNAITLGYAQVTSSFTTTSATVVQVTGLSVTVTIPAGGRRIQITAFCSSLYATGSAGNAQATIWDGTVGSGTQLAGGANNTTTTTAGIGTVYAVVTPSAGSKTYNVGLQIGGGGTGHFDAAATSPAFILVKVI